MRVCVYVPGGGRRLDVFSQRFWVVSDSLFYVLEMRDKWRLGKVKNNVLT